MARLIKTARGGITSEHGESVGRTNPHVGIDIGHGNSTADDLRMVAPADGRVTYAGWSKGSTYGNHVIITHADGTWSRIAHMDSLAVKVGDTVTQGQTIGVMGRTGGPWGSKAGWFVHGHQEYHLADGRAVNPLDYMSTTAATGTTPLEDDMTPAQEKMLAEVHWMLSERVRPQLNALHDGTGGAVHKKLDIIAWALTDPKAGLRKMVGDLITKLIPSWNGHPVLPADKTGK
ncbi:M23 family metallopeptidase [Glaciibacter psychrotolerans]|uniref:M23ase beta-sheet core domain-containing protein n=1 Tax=Glaciibacter psychrotolerans TaxID=670054 RepID=A0A7Z0EDJ7_9MICO|nr:M23 family metallopeptidase [Leifsonia psychrotolerans]NYJ19210.1 hypothetical protein [Leifsonia psychrotolerans]